MSCDSRLAPPIALPWASPAFHRTDDRSGQLRVQAQVPEKDRRVLEADTLIAAAVAVDVLATRCRRISESPSMLQDLTEAALAVGAESGFDGAAARRLIVLAAGETGRARENLSSHGAWGNSSARSASVTPEAVMRGLERLVRGTARVVDEATLIVEASWDTHYQKV